MSAVMKEEDFVEARIARLESDVAHIRSDMSEMKTDIRELKHEVGGLKEKHGELHGEFKELRGEFKALDAKLDASVKMLLAEIAKSAANTRVWMVLALVASLTGLADFLWKVLEHVGPIHH